MNRPHAARSDQHQAPDHHPHTHPYAHGAPDQSIGDERPVGVSIQTVRIGLLTDPRLRGRGNGVVRISMMLNAQRTYGNRAVQRLLSGRRGAAAGKQGAHLPVQRNTLNFHHGTRVKFVAPILQEVKPVGTGDFAQGFYLHHNVDDAAAFRMALEWAIKIIGKHNSNPETKPEDQEKSVAVITFKVPEADFNALKMGSKYKEFNLTNANDPNYKAKQDEWLKFIVGKGRKPDLTFRPAGPPGGNDPKGVWRHDEVAQPPNLGYNLMAGPFYGGVRGTQSKPPGPEDFKPFAKPTGEIPHQYVFNNEGITLLNSNKVQKTSKIIDLIPPSKL